MSQSEKHETVHPEEVEFRG